MFLCLGCQVHLLSGPARVLQHVPQTRSVFVKAFADSVNSQKRAAADGECREECLLQETATKEAAMATRMEEVQAELKQSRLALGNADAEIERLGVFSSQMKKVLRLLLATLEHLHLALSESLVHD